MDLKLENMFTINTSILRYNNAILQKEVYLTVVFWCEGVDCLKKMTFRIATVNLLFDTQTTVQKQMELK